MLKIAQHEAADALLNRDPLALLIAMLLDQQQPMERAFAGPYQIASRMRVKKLSAKKIANMDPSDFLAIVSEKPAVHRFPKAMAARIQKLCAIIDEQHAGKAERVWVDEPNAAELLQRIKKLPGFGEDKAKIFIALLGKQLGIRPKGWREVSAPYGEPGSKMTVADVKNPKTLLEVRAYKQQMKAAGIW